MVDYKAVRGGESRYGPGRYILIDKVTGDLLDDAQGCGYKTPHNAYAAARYKFPCLTERQILTWQERHISRWLEDHPDFVRDMEATTYAAVRGQAGHITAQRVQELLDSMDEAGLAFTASELLQYWQRGPTVIRAKNGKRRR